MKDKHGKAPRRGVLICGAYGHGNAGDDAILEAIVQEMREIDAEMPIWVLSRTPRETQARFGIGSVHIFNVFGFLRIMRRTRLYISGGGSLIQDVTSRRSLWYYLASI
ncbi:MAG: polysaccharide pyruvyl transferase family protein, partial [Oscillospiraceae bacterium]|nr:polysaccharide pyruvyl transferase family protein [Oscillospiraceae bacterium]